MVSVNKIQRNNYKSEKSFFVLDLIPCNITLIDFSVGKVILRSSPQY